MIQLTISKLFFTLVKLAKLFIIPIFWAMTFISCYVDMVPFGKCIREANDFALGYLKE